MTASVESSFEPLIEPMQACHLSAVVDIESQVSPHPWRRKQFADSLERNRCFVLKMNNSVVGFLVYRVVADQADLFNIAVSAEHQGLGLGRQLMQRFLGQLEGQVNDVFLEVRCSNDTALNLYSRFGFVETCCRENYYTLTDGSREDAILMALAL